MRMLILGVIALGSTAALANPPAQSSSGTPAANNRNDPNRVICETTPVTGSRLSSNRVCMTRAQWAEYRRSSSEALQQAQTMQPN